MITAFPPMKAPEADHAFYLAEHLASHALDVHVVTTKDSIAASHSGITIHPIMRDWSWSDLPRLARFITRCSPDAILLVYIGWIYNYHPMLTFVPTVSKTLLPRVRFVTLFEDAQGAFSYPPSLLGQAVRKGVELWKSRNNNFGTLPSRSYRSVQMVRRGIELWAGRRNGHFSFRALPHWPYPLVRVVRKGMELWAGRKNTDFNFGTLLRDSDRIIAVSDQTRAGLAERFSDVNSKSLVIPPPPIMRMCPEENGATRQRTREALRVKPGDFLTIYFGYIYPGKGVETLLKAFHMVSARRRNVKLMIVGGSIELLFQSYTGQMHEMAKQIGIDDRVIWTGEYPWDSDEASRYLRAADFCVLPFDSGVSIHNTSFAAAAAHGLPVITTHGEVLEQAFIHQENVFLCPPQNPEAIAIALETLMDNPDLRQCLHLGALKLSNEWFSWERAVERTMATLAG